ncbi:MAG: DUF2232 domain-containing protein [Sneathiellaceae bacterium]
MRQGWLFGLGCGLGAVLLLGIAELAPLTALLIYGIPMGPFVAGLVSGVGPALLAALVFLLVALMFSPTSAAILFATLALPAALLSWQALQRPGGAGRTSSGAAPQWTSAGSLLGSLALGGAAIGLAAQIAIGSQQEEAVRFLMAQMAPLTEPGPDGRTQIEPNQLESLVTASLEAAPLGVGAIWVLVMAVNGALAQAIARNLGRNLRPSPSYRRARVPGWVLYAMGAALLLGLAPDPLGRVGTVVGILLAMGYLMQGLAVMHVLARRTGGGRWLLIPFYILFVVVGPLMPFAVVVLGLVEDHVRYRDREGGPVGKEDE